MAFRGSKIVLILLQILAFWSVWRWYFLRLSSSADEFYGILALLAIAVLSFKFRIKDSAVLNFKFIIASIAVYAVLFPFLPPLLRAVIAVTSLTFTISGFSFGKRFHFGIWSLFLLSLPFVASMQFYLGFPLRVLVGEATAFLLKLNGLSVFREGVCLFYGEQIIWIDAPCSGVKMLWMGFFLTGLLINIYRFSFVKSLLAFLSAFAIILIGNIFRATGLFYLEAGIIELPDSAHEAIGVSAFILTCAGIVFALLKLRDFNVFESKNNSGETKSCLNFSLVQIAVFALVCLSAFAVPFFVGGRENIKPVQTNIEFPTEFENKPLRLLDLSEREQFFLNDFPGEIRRFTDGRREIIIRFVSEATRKLHPASDCFSAIGYQIAPLPLKIDETGQKWSCFTAARDEENLKVCERIYTDTGESWTDVSSWYWSAIGSENKGYWAVTVAESNE